MRALAVVLTLVGAVNVAGADTAAARLQSGVYKFGGRCRITAADHEDPLPTCESYMGIVASDPDLPLFVIPLQGGHSAWQFKITTPGSLSEDGKVMTYPITSMIYLATTREASREYLDHGACINSVRVGEPLLHCTTWSDETRKTVVREVIFEGDGKMMFDRTPSK